MSVLPLMVLDQDLCTRDTCIGRRRDLTACCPIRHGRDSSEPVQFLSLFVFVSETDLCLDFKAYVSGSVAGRIGTLVCVCGHE